MKWLFYTLLVLLASVGIALFALPDPGYVLIGYGNYSVETSLVLLVAFLLLAYVAVRLLAGLWRVPARIHRWEQRRRALQARSRLDRGLVRLLEGDWKVAEQRLSQLVKNRETPLITYLAAARAAQQQGSDKRRDHYLRLARQSAPGAELAVGLSQAELQIAAGQLPQAAATLSRLHGQAPRQVRVLQMLVDLYQQMHDWSRLRELLPAVRRRKALEGEALNALTVQVYGNLMKRAAGERDLAALKELWSDVPAHVTQDAGLLELYAGCLLQLGAEQDAETLIVTRLRHGWSKRLVYLYGKLHAGDAAARLATAETWLKRHDKDPVLLLTLARLSLRNQLWGKARHYLEASIGLHPTAESYRLLGELLERLGETDKAAEAWRTGLKLADSESAAGLLPGG